MWVLTPRLKKSGKGVKATWRIAGTADDVSAKEILELGLARKKLLFHFSTKGKYGLMVNPYQLLLNLILSFELLTGKTDTKTTRRIIKNGGLVNYAKKLERLLNESTTK